MKRMKEIAGCTATFYAVDIVTREIKELYLFFFLPKTYYCQSPLEKTEKCNLAS